MAVSEAEKTDVFQFLVIRPPNSVSAVVADRRFIKDDDDLFSLNSTSTIGPMVYKKVFCGEQQGNSTNFPVVSTAAIEILQAILEMLPSFVPLCPNPEVAGSLEDLRDRTYITGVDRFYVLPDHLEHLQGREEGHRCSS